MTALADRAQQRHERTKKAFRLRVGANVKIWEGARCGILGSYVVPVTATTGLRHFCRALETVDNTGGAAGALYVDVEFSTMKVLVPLINDTVAPVTVSEIGENCYFMDDSGVVSASSASGARSRAGTPWKIVSTTDPLGEHPGVYVELDPTGADTTLAALAVDVAAIEAAAAAALQAVNATLVAGTVTIAAGITVAANTEVIPVLIGAITGSTNFGSVGELKASRVNGAPGVGTVVIQAYGNNGALDVDAAGAIRVVLLTPQP